MPEGLPNHHMPADDFLSLARGDGDNETLDRLLSGERSRRMLLLRALDDILSAGRAGASGPLGSFDGAWALLARTQRRDPDAVEDVFRYPQTGMWLTHALRRLGGAVDEDVPLWVVLGHLPALAAAAGARAGVDFSIDVPVRHGQALLPTLGCAVLPAAGPWTTATVRASDGEVRMGTRTGEVLVPARFEDDAPGWFGLRRITAGPAGRAVSLTLDDLDPYRTFPRPSEALRLDPVTATRWQGLLAQAWEVLLRDEPQTVGAMSRGLISLTPMPPSERFRPSSITAGDAFGGVVASEPDDATQLAVTLVHEFQHTKLGGLLHLAPLLAEEPATGAGQELFYAPWRDDPRPLSGLIQGIYAFFGVARFWGSHRHSAESDEAAVAHFEFALWREQVWRTVLSVQHHERLTPLGLRLLEHLRRRCARWLEEVVPPQQLALAEEVAADHRARWRAHHLRPGSRAVDDAAGAWLAGARRPPASLAAEPELAPDARARWLDTAAVLARQSLSDPDRPRGAPRHGPEKSAADVSGVTTGDLLLAGGDPAGARRAFEAQLAADPGQASAWAGLGRALTSAGVEPAAATLLRRHPERARSVQRALLSTGGEPADPVRLAAWLAGTA